MKVGIIIIFHNNAKEIDKDFFIENASKIKNSELCLVNNDSKDNTYEILKEIKDECVNVSVVNIKSYKLNISAIRAGARFMFNQFKLSHIGYINVNDINEKSLSLNLILERVINNYDDIIKCNNDILQKNKVKQTLFQRLFSILDYLKKLELEKQFNKLHCQNRA